MFNLFNKSKTQPGKNLVLKLSGLHCTSCALNIDGILEDLNGVIKTNTSYAKSEARVTYDDQKLTPEAIIAEIEKAGYQADKIL